MSNRRFIKLYALSLLLLIVFAVLLFNFINAGMRSRLIHEMELESSTILNQLSKQMNLAFIDIQSDLKFLGEQERLHHLTHPGADSRELAEEEEELWISFARQRARYDQIRFLNSSGDEVIRVNYNQGTPHAISGNDLQSKHHRYYFTEAISLPPGEIYVSPLDLNVENGTIELPLKPMIRFAMPLAGDRGENAGVMVLNYLARNLLDEFRRTARGFYGDAVLSNAQGYLLLSPDSAQDWSFMFPDSPQSGIQNQYPAIWQQIKNSARGQILTPEGLFTYDSINPSGPLLAPDCASCMKIVLRVPGELIRHKFLKRWDERRPSLVLTLLLMGLSLALFIWYHKKRRVHERQISALNEQIALERNLFVSGPGIIVKLRNELGWPVDYISPNAEALLGYKPEAFRDTRLTFSSLIEPGYLPQYANETEQADLHKHDTFKRSAYQVIDREGNRKWIQDVCRTIRDRHGRITSYYSHLSDISPLKLAEQKLKASRDSIQKVLDTVPDPTLVIDVSTFQVQLANQAARDLYNGGRVFRSNMTCYHLTHKRDTPCDEHGDPCPIKELQRVGHAASARHKHLSEQGEQLYVEVRATPLFDGQNREVVQIVESHRDVTETVRVEQRLQHMATTDRLTQVCNRLKFDEELKHQIEWAQSTDNPLGLVMFDLDYFKRINDNHGHAVGDEVLKRIVETVRHSIRKSDTLARWGGEEFMIILPLTNVAELNSICEFLRDRLQHVEHETVGSVTASFGASVLRPEESFSSFVQRVDGALYQSKRSGRNRCTVID